ncbi:Predicted metal-dependent phosphoesterase TrpH, contains PHP domain [Luteibacter sp. UNC138MFCol5.1]|uniref:CehA/McbA family metallohydrolase n=1 Tax=Luteibacter sp. UNC138MFCol5.1 TaxID=1502774 RepID=UPI0008C1C07F|nr:CehA/McbA family metallohydrolase [Luteibacter sp. UNC138MFCol5.1]SEP02162.1 Predicted metal-dependent phosphoesterase TrpH, contains PHP domain [Luteibacter sp. UNC138MFCol5.1]
MRALIAIALACLAAAPVSAERAPDLVLTGALSGRDQHTYRELPFDVPKGTSRITVDVDYTGRAEKTTIDLGLLGPGGFEAQDGFRGWSGGGKHRFTVSATDATASYLPGAIEPGRWRILLGIPNIRSAANATFTAKVWLSKDDEGFGPEHGLTAALSTQDRWYRGDLHMHSAHSDGNCTSASGTRKVGCPLFLTVASAAKRGLDFIAVSEHNTMSHVSELRELQPYFDTMLLIPAREVTTFEGHANLFGVSRTVDFRLGGKAVPDWNALLADVARAHGVISINHPRRPNDETCMGCGFTPRGPVDMRGFQAIEVVNGRDAQRADSGLPFWEAQLNEGLRITAIGGSDSHDGSDDPRDAYAGAIGTPTTVVRAREQSMEGILDGIRAGHVFVDAEGTRDRLLDVVATAGGARASMGDAIAVPAGAPLHVDVKTAGVIGAVLTVTVDGKRMDRSGKAIPVDGAVSFDWPGDGGRHWLRVDVRAPDGGLLVLGNPVYINH